MGLNIPAFVHAYFYSALVAEVDEARCLLEHDGLAVVDEEPGGAVGVAENNFSFHTCGCAEFGWGAARALHNLPTCQPLALVRRHQHGQYRPLGIGLGVGVLR